MPITREYKYGDAGDRYPIKMGETWRVGDAVLRCGDLEAGDGMKLVLDYKERPKLMVTDPPWNSGNARTFRGKAGLDRPVDFPNLMSCVLELGVLCKGEVWIEMGVQYLFKLTEQVRALHGHVLQTFETTYYKKRPNRLMRCVFHGEWCALPLFDPTGMDDADFTAPIIAHYSQPGDVVCDPCTGQGQMAVDAIKQGRRFIGLELNPRRLAVTVDKLVQLTGAKPEKL